jgi:3-carboxy-cis,cis-muconate cycloisomerase
MPAHPADSQLYARLFGDPDTARLFSDSAEVRAMMLVEGALARVQGDMGLIPADAGAFLYRAAQELQIDPGALAAETGANGVPVPALVTAFRKAAMAPEHAQWLHWGATSQDVMDTALVLRLRQVLALWDTRLGVILQGLATLARDHAETAMLARTYGQAAVPTSFGAQVAGWGGALLRHRSGLQALAPRVLVVQFGGAAGTLSALGDRGPEVRAALAQALGLADPSEPWHSTRDRIADLSAAACGLCVTLGKMGEDLLVLTQSGLAEVAIAGAGASSTMPQKQNPVAPSVLVALARQSVALSGALTGAGLHREARDGAAWFTEWLTLPPLMMATGAALGTACDMVPRLRPDAGAMARNIAADGGMAMAEALTFALAARIPRPEAQAALKSLAQEARATGAALTDLFALRYPDIALPGTPLGEAPDLARRFAARVAAQG